MTTARRIRIDPPLPCCARAGWELCGNPATIGIAELRALATGHVWEVRAYCPEHDPQASAPARQRRRADPTNA